MRVQYIRAIYGLYKVAFKYLETLIQFGSLVVIAFWLGA